MSDFSISTLDQPTQPNGVRMGWPQQKTNPNRGTAGGVVFYLSGEQVPATLKNFTFKTKNITPDSSQDQQPMSVDISLGYIDGDEAKAYTNYVNELWRQPGITLPIDKNEYSTISLDLINAPVLSWSADKPVTYALFIDPNMAGQFTLDGRIYDLAIAASPIGPYGERLLAAVQALNIQDREIQNYYQIQTIFAPDFQNSISGSLEFSETQLTSHEGTSSANRMIGSRYGDLMNGNNGDDVIVSGNGKDVLQGGNGNDKLAGGNGSDKLIGGAGNDALNGGSGDDWLTGGSGEDKFIVSKGRDTITDYIADEGDVIRINSKIFTSFELAQDGADVVLTAIISPDRDAKLTIVNATVDEIVIRTVPDL